MRHWVYHPKEEAKIVEEQEYKLLLNKGWYDSPAKFLQKNEEGILGKIENQDEVKAEAKEEVIKKRGRPSRVG